MNIEKFDFIKNETLKRKVDFLKIDFSQDLIDCANYIDFYENLLRDFTNENNLVFLIEKTYINNVCFFKSIFIESAKERPASFANIESSVSNCPNPESYFDENNFDKFGETVVFQKR